MVFEAESGAPEFRWRGTRVHSATRMHCLGALGGFVGIVMLLLMGAPSLLRVAYPALAFPLAIFLFTRSRTTYIGFVFSLWYVSPFLRRMVDDRAGFVPTNPLLLASFLATAVSGWVLVTHVRALAKPAALPFSCAFGAIAFGTVMGLTRYPAMAVAQAVLNWIVPVFFAFFLYAERHRYREYQRVIERSILYGTLVAGAYGVFQFFLLPEWDRKWMVDLGAQPFGVPEPLQIRVFSTLNAPATCAIYMAAGLLLLFALKGRMRMIAAPFAFVALLLTSSRSSWVGLFFGVAYLTLLLPNRARLRVVSGMVACVVLMMVATLMPVVGDVVSTRLQSFTDPKNDVSYNERVDGHLIAFQKFAGEPMGEGMGSVDTDHTTSGADSGIGPHDSTLLESMYALGLPGSLLYLVGIGAGVLRIFSKRNGGTREPFAVSLRAILVCFLVQVTLNSIFVGVFGFLVWAVMGMALASGELRESELSRSR